MTPIGRSRCPAGAARPRRHRRCAGSACAPRRASASYQPCAVLHGMAIAPQPARCSPSMPRSSQGSGSAPPLEPADRPVRHPRVGPQHGRDVVLIARCRRQQREPHHELGARQRAHAAEHTQHPVIARACDASIGGILTAARKAGTYAMAMMRRIELQGHRGARGLFPRTRWPASPERWRSAWMRSNSTWA